MSQPFLGEIRMVGFNFAPRSWSFCDGQILPINQNQALFSLLGTTYGGDGRTTFALPDLRGRSPLGFSSTLPWGSRAGTENETISIAQMPVHSHELQANSGGANSNRPAGNYPGEDTVPVLYRPLEAAVPMAANSISALGGGQSHTNMQPFIALNFCIAFQGIFPSRN